MLIKLSAISGQLSALIAFSIIFHLPALAQKHELAFTVGRVLSSERNSQQGALDLGTGTAVQVNYAYRLIDGGAAALYGEVHFLASPLRDISAGIPTATRDFATLYLTPGLRLKFLPGARVSPYVVVGGGYALYEQSTQTIGNQPNPAARRINRAALDYGGGVDVKVLRFLSLRGEIRDFYTGSPSYNVPFVSGGQHNVVAGGGVVLQLR